jgi:hypothetical protein
MDILVWAAASGPPVLLAVRPHAATMEEGTVAAAETEMAGVNSVRATITKATDGWYTLTISIRENGRSRVLIEKPVASITDAERAAEEFAARRGAPWHTVEVLYRY